jgi:hypothetical protein
MSKCIHIQIKLFQFMLIAVCDSSAMCGALIHAVCAVCAAVCDSDCVRLSGSAAV